MNKRFDNVHSWIYFKNLNFLYENVNISTSDCKTFALSTGLWSTFSLKLVSQSFPSALISRKFVLQAGSYIKRILWKVSDYLNVSQLRNKKQNLHPDFLLFSLFSLGIILQDALRGKTLIFQSHLTLLL